MILATEDRIVPDQQRAAIAGPFSLYLDLVRFVAACTVVVAHFSQHGLVPAAWAPRVPDLGRAAVIVFFVLSGYVIAWTTDSRHQRFGDYAVARCARIYSVALPVLLASFLVMAIASRVGTVDPVRFYVLNKPWLYLPLHALFLGQAWNLAEVPPWLEPYWSLGFEVWYYVMFAAVHFLRGWKRPAAVALVLLIGGHKLWLLLPVWWSGVLLYRMRGSAGPSPAAARIGWIATIVLLGLFKFLALDQALRALGRELWPFSGLRLGMADRFLADYVVCLLVWVHFLCARRLAFARLAAWARPIRALAGYTFTLYLTHALVLCVWEQFHPAPTTGAEVLLLLGMIGAVTWMAGRVTEQRKGDWKAFFERLFGRFGYRPATRGA